jgi:hypothetical protein
MKISNPNMFKKKRSKKSQKLHRASKPEKITDSSTQFQHKFKGSKLGYLRGSVCDKKSSKVFASSSQKLFIHSGKSCSRNRNRKPSKGVKEFERAEQDGVNPLKNLNDLYMKTINFSRHKSNSKT